MGKILRYADVGFLSHVPVIMKVARIPRSNFVHLAMVIIYASYSYNRSLGPSGTELLSSIAHLPKASAKGFGTGPVRCLQDRRMEDRAENQILGLG